MKLSIRKVVVLGAGVMGAAIAGHLAGNGVQVVLLDMPSAQEPRSKLAQDAKKRLRNPRMRALYGNSAAALIHTGNLEDDLEQVADADWVIEAIVERLEPKIDLFGRVAALTKEGCILSSNTSGISVNAIGQGLQPQQRKYFLGTHFFNPPRYMKLLELIPVEETATEVMEAMAVFAEKRLGKTIVVAKDSPNFIANRVGVATMALLFHGMEQFDITVAAADFLSGRFVERSALGSLKTADLVGFDIVKATMNTNHIAEQNPQEQALMNLPDYFVGMLEKGMLGDKSKAGFFKREGKESFMWDRHTENYVPAAYALPDGINPKAPVAERVFALIDSGTAEGAFLWHTLKGLFCYCANRVPEIADEFQKLDQAMQLGYNWNMGPFQLWDALGTEEISRRMADDAGSLPIWVAEHLAQNGGRFYAPDQQPLSNPYLSVDSESVSTVWASEDVQLKDLGDGIGAIVLCTPRASVSRRTVENLVAAVVEAELRFEGAVLTGAGKNFCVGAELREVAELIDRQDWTALRQDIAAFQQMTNRIKYASIPIVAAPYATAMGGGAELCLHAHKIVAHSELYLGLVEAQVGVIPGGGGLKELALRCAELLRFAPELDMLPLIKRYALMVAGVQVSSSALHAKELGLLRPTDRIVPKQEMLLEAAKEEALALSRSFVPLVPLTMTASGTTGYAAIMAAVNDMVLGGFASEYDGTIAGFIARAITGGNLPDGTVVTEESLLLLEQDGFVWLCQQPKTYERIESLLTSGRMKRN